MKWLELAFPALLCALLLIVMTLLVALLIAQSRGYTGIVIG